jgi:hypothetical protein
MLVQSTGLFRHCHEFDALRRCAAALVHQFSPQPHDQQLVFADGRRIAINSSTMNRAVFGRATILVGAAVGGSKISSR